jgi:hypothetical protein
MATIAQLKFHLVQSSGKRPKTAELVTPVDVAVGRLIVIHLFSQC